jgi:hypothetical protein
VTLQIVDSLTTQELLVVYVYSTGHWQANAALWRQKLKVHHSLIVDKNPIII